MSSSRIFKTLLTGSLLSLSSAVSTAILDDIVYATEESTDYTPSSSQMAQDNYNKVGAVLLLFAFAISMKAMALHARSEAPWPEINNEDSNEDSAVIIKEEIEPENILAERLHAINYPDEAINKLFICPITREIMQNPVVASDGHTYERYAIQNWIQQQASSPVEGKQIQVEKTLYPNKNLRSEILEFVEKSEREYKSKQMRL